MLSERAHDISIGSACILEGGMYRSLASQTEMLAVLRGYFDSEYEKDFK